LKLSGIGYRINYLYTTALTSLFVIIALGMIFFPSTTISGAVSGLKIFAFILVPALFPFLILSEILMGLGFVHFIGTLLEPLMRPIFRIPGMGAFAVAMSLASGYLTGAIITAKLRKDKMCTRIEAERLLAITNVSNPIFILGSVAVGMFKSPQLGLTLALAHYLACLLVGVVFRFYGKEEPSAQFQYPKGRHILIRAFQEMYQTRLADGRPLGQLLGESVQHAVNNMFLIGGFLILFSVIIRLLTVMGITQLLCLALAKFLIPLGISINLAPAIVNGFFEVTLGSTLAGQALAPLWQKVVIASSIIAWSGLSVHAQVTSIISRTDIRITPYLAARVLHTLFATILSFFLFKVLFVSPYALALPALASSKGNLLLNYFSFSFATLCIIILVFLLLALIFVFIQRLKIVIYKITK